MDDAATVREWTTLLARVRFGTQKVAGRTITGAAIKAVAGRYATYADSDGSRVRPGIARVSVDLETSYTTVKGATTVLRRCGLLRLVAKGNRHRADEYQLAIPTTLLEQPGIELWSPAKHTLEIERVRDSNRGRYKATDPQVPQVPADAPEPQAPEVPAEADLRVPGVPADAPGVPSSAGTTGTSKQRSAGTTGTSLRVPQVPATDQRPIHNYDRANSGDPRTELAVPRARARQDHDSSDGQHDEPTPPPAAAPDRPQSEAEAARANIRATLAAARQKRHPDRTNPTGRAERHNHAAALAAIDAAITEQATARTTADEPQEQPA